MAANNSKLQATTQSSPQGASAYVDVEAWNSSTLKALNGLSLAPTRPIRGASVSLAISLDDSAPAPVIKADDSDDEGAEQATTGYPPLRRKTSRRDSMRRRDELLKGKEGSRRRQKWENDHLLGNPHVQPPLPTDWEVRPTYPVRTVPYYLATLWDAKRAEEERVAATRKNKPTKRKELSQPEGLGRVPKGLKDTMKRHRAAKTLLQELENEIREFVVAMHEGGQVPDDAGIEVDADDDDFVLVDEKTLSPIMSHFPTYEKLIFESPETDQSATFSRWLVHALGKYYGLDSWSVSVQGKPARREAYVGIKDVKLKRTCQPSMGSLPLPMWARV
ncbi:hypothetical protein BT63DRAFT_421599 [Microthyrium microscopicum]|uniref:R3H-associated N-terminal domain-containing protein n=1 Tax=Microthyrium microscopicum TaxID=703497 RepID=A0A6A6UMH2_9PEZI|nr:hypothetical protein BT63DRAFT_421599 [Microthyrium microscopicum]